MFDEPDPQFAGGSVTAPPAYVQQAAQVAAPPRYQGADPVLANPEFQRFIPPGFTGTRYQLPYENQQALHDYVTYKADKEAEDQNYVRDIVRHGKVEDSFKAVQAAKRFIGQRRFANDYAAALDSGLPPEKALPAAMYKNAPDLFAGSPGQMSSAFRSMREAPPAPVLGGVEVVNDPQTGKRIGLSYHGGKGHVQLVKDIPTGLNPSQTATDKRAAASRKLSANRAALAVVDKEMEALHPKTAIPWIRKGQDVDKYGILYAKRQRLVRAIESAGLDEDQQAPADTQAAAPAAAPSARIQLPKTKAELKAGVEYETSRGPAKWNGQNFVPVK